MLAISIDSGGTKVAAAVVDHDGNIIQKQRYPVEERSGNFLISAYKKIIEQFTEEYPIDVIGISGNGRIDSDRGVIVDCGVHSDWQGRNVVEEIEAFAGIPTCIHNDCHCAIKGELWKGTIRDYDVIVGLIIGTGMGGAMVDHGKFWYGRQFGAGEVGHTIIHPNGIPCSCGQRGCAERYTSGTALWTNYNAKGPAVKISSGYEFFECVRKGDALAAEVLHQFTEDLALNMASIANLCAPEVFLIGGGISETHEFWDTQLREAYARYVGRGLRDTDIVYASTGNDAGILGAAGFAFEMMEKKGVAGA